MQKQSVARRACDGRHRGHCPHALEMVDLLLAMVSGGVIGKRVRDAVTHLRVRRAAIENDADQ